MSPDAFRKHVIERIEASIEHAERELGRALPRELAFQWNPGEAPRFYGGEIADEIVRHVFVAEDKIYPCVDLGPAEVLADGKLLIIGLRAGYPLAPFGKNWHGDDGPFILIYGQRLADQVA